MFSSEGKSEVVAPSSAPILVMVLLSGTLNVLIPSPEYSKILPTPPLTDFIDNTLRMISLADTPERKEPVK